MKHIPIKGVHNFEKLNNVTLKDRKGHHDVLKCSKCGIQGKTRQLTMIEIPGRYSIDKINNCDGTFVLPKQIKIIRCNAYGDLFKNLTPDSIHNTVDPPANYKHDNRGVWVMGVSEPVKVLNDEFIAL